MRFTLCLSENYGLRAYMGGRYYDVELAEPVTDCVGDSMPVVEKELIYRYFYADTHSGRAAIRAGWNDYAGMAGNTDNKIMKTLVAVHKILGVYDDCLDSDSLDLERLNAKSLKISENRFSKIIIMLSEAGYISGVDVREFSDGSRGVDYSDSRITLDGLKYHAENSLFLKAAGFLPDLLSAGVSVIAG